MTKKQEVAFNISFWIFFLGLDLYSNWISEKDFFNLWNILQFVSFSLLQMIVFYLNYLWICEKTVPQKKWGLFVVGQAFLLFLFPFLRHFSEEVVIYRITGVHNYKDYGFTFYYIYDNSYYAIRIILFSLVFYFIKNIWNTNQKMNELLLQKKQAELQNLKNQLSPHFLFNTLNSFYADLMDSQPKVAGDMLKLSEMLRYVTYENSTDKVFLQDDIQFIRNYVALFSRRFDGALHVEIRTETVHPGKSQIPSLLLIHFVENALKHGIITDAEKPVRISLETQDQRLFFMVENYFEISENYDESGIGYQNIQKRLDLIFSQNYSLKIHQETDFYQVSLQIPLL